MHSKICAEIALNPNLCWDSISCLIFVIYDNFSVNKLFVSFSYVAHAWCDPNQYRHDLEVLLNFIGTTL